MADTYANAHLANTYPIASNKHAIADSNRYDNPNKYANTDANYYANTIANRPMVYTSAYAKLGSN